MQPRARMTMTERERASVCVCLQAQKMFPMVFVQTEQSSEAFSRSILRQVSGVEAASIVDVPRTVIHDAGVYSTVLRE